MKYLVVILFIALTALFGCVKESDLERATNPLVGEWTYSAIEYDIKVNNQDINTYLDSLNVAPENITLYTILINSEIQSQLEGSLIRFEADNSYEILDLNEFESSGTYELNSQENTLTLIDDSIDGITLQILNLNNKSLTLAGAENVETPDEINLFDAILNISFKLDFIK